MTLKQYSDNGWFHKDSLPEVIRVLQLVSTNPDDQRWLDHSRVKYISVRIDMRFGNFIILDADGHIIPLEKLLKIFPEFV